MDALQAIILAAFLSMSVAAGTAGRDECSVRIERCHFGPVKILQTEALLPGTRLDVMDTVHLVHPEPGCSDDHFSSLIEIVRCGKALTLAAAPYYFALAVHRLV